MKSKILKVKSVDLTPFLEFILEKSRFEIQRDGYELNDKQKVELDGYIKRREAGEPVDYILGYRNFYGYDFKVGPGVLIPRFETELLVEKVGKFVEGKKVLDLCTGSGCIGITLLKEFNPDIVLCTDVSDKALEFAKINAKNILNSDEKAKATFIKSDMFKKIDQKFDVIVSNPPYIERNVISTLEKQVRGFEPIIALEGGNDGYDFYREIKNNIKNFLNSGGMVFLEIGYNQGDRLKKMFSDCFKEVNILKDYNNFDRILIGKNIKN
ncbi:MAG: peptide chain release factor N(5)-glutamine methyltransferase [Candidatus Muiribacteriota bacterium]